jgi:hypothetical protein
VHERKRWVLSERGESAAGVETFDFTISIEDARGGMEVAIRRR